jgi:hypothetical protein
MKALNLLPVKPTFFQIVNYLLNPEPAMVAVKAEGKLSPAQIRRLVRARRESRPYPENW